MHWQVIKVSFVCPMEASLMVLPSWLLSSTEDLYLSVSTALISSMDLLEYS